MIWWISTELVLRDHRLAYAIPHDRWRDLCKDRPCQFLEPTAQELRFGTPIEPRGVIVLEGEYEMTDEATGAYVTRLMRWWYICIVVVGSNDGGGALGALRNTYGGSWLWELSTKEVKDLIAAMEADPNYTASPLLNNETLAPTQPLQFDLLELPDYVERVTDLTEHSNNNRVYATMMYPMSGPLGDGIRETESEQLETIIHCDCSTARHAWLTERPRAASRRLCTDKLSPRANASASAVLDLHRASLRARLCVPFDDALPEDLRRYFWAGFASHLVDRHTAPQSHDTGRKQLLTMRLVCRESDAAVREVGTAATIRLMRTWLRSWDEGSSPGHCAWLRFVCIWYGFSPLDVEQQFTKAVLKGKGKTVRKLDESNINRERWILFLRLFGNVELGCAPPAIVRPQRAKPPPRDARRVVLTLTSA
jgi:hypothetical protein